MRILVLTIFPDMFDGLWSHGMVRRAIEQQAIAAAALNIRDFAGDRHHVTDDRPYGGGCGMVMKPEPLAGAIRAARAKAPGARTILMTPQGRVFTQAAAAEGLTCGIALPIFAGDFLTAVLVIFCGDDQAHAGAIELWANDPALTRDLTLAAREYFPRVKAVLSTWMYDTPPEGGGGPKYTLV